jgi:hypothetical protein
MDPLTTAALITAGSSLLGGAAGLFGGGSDNDKTTTQTTQNRPTYTNAFTEDMWNQVYNTYYPKTHATYAGDSQKATILEQWRQLGGGDANFSNQWSSHPYVQQVISERTAKLASDYPELNAFLNANGLSLASSTADLTAKLDADTSLTGGTNTPTTDPSYEQMYGQDIDAKRAAGQTYIDEATKATQPYTDLLNQYVSQGNKGEGLFTPTQFGFMGQNIGSFIPLSNRNTANQLAGFSGQAAKNQVGLAEDQRDLDQTYTPNAARLSYIDQLLSKVMPLINTSGSSMTQNVSGGGNNTVENTILSGIAGATAGSKIAGALPGGSSSAITTNSRPSPTWHQDANGNWVWS